MKIDEDTLCKTNVEHFFFFHWGMFLLEPFVHTGRDMFHVNPKLIILVSKCVVNIEVFRYGYVEGPEFSMLI